MDPGWVLVAPVVDWLVVRVVDILDVIAEVFGLFGSLDNPVDGFCNPEPVDNLEDGKLSFDPKGCAPNDRLVGAARRLDDSKFVENEVLSTENKWHLVFHNCRQIKLYF